MSIERRPCDDAEEKTGCGRRRAELNSYFRSKRWHVADARRRKEEWIYYYHHWSRLVVSAATTLFVLLFTLSCNQKDSSLVFCSAFSRQQSIFLRINSAPRSSLLNSNHRHRRAAAAILNSATNGHDEGEEEESLVGTNNSLDANLVHSCVELADPETGCRTVLVGCFHGSSSSAADVAQCLDRDTDVIVLELCPSRFADLRRDWERRRALASAEENAEDVKAAYSSTNNNNNNVDRSETQQPTKPWLARFFRMVQRTSQTQGMSAGAAAAILGSVSGFQTALSGLEPGLEFTTALESATRRDTDIILADQTVDDTLFKLGRLPVVSLRMWKDWAIDKRFSWRDSSFCGEASALRTALLGNRRLPEESQLSLASFLSRSRDALRDLVRLTLPPFAILLLLSTALDPANWQAAEEADIVNSSASTSGILLPTVENLVMLVMDAMALLVGYLTVVLPATAVVLRERDDRLVEGIREACRVAAAKWRQDASRHAGNGDSEQQPSRLASGNHDRDVPRVVAVLGLLHVNGVAERLLETPSFES